MELFPSKMEPVNQFTLEGIASKLFYFEAQLQLNHWKTMSFAEHKATNELYDFISDFRDGVMEKLMGYQHKRPTQFKLQPIVDKSSIDVVSEICNWAYTLYEWAGENNYCDVENMAQELSGEGSRCKYLLSLS